MELLIFSVCTALFILAAVMSSLTQIHMFQLNGYHPFVQLKWIGGHIVSVITNLYALVFCAAAVVTGLGRGGNQTAILVIHIMFSAAFIMFALSNLPKKKAKKPLVFTARVKRMYCAYTVLLAATAAAAALLYAKTGAWIGYAVLFAGYFLIPLLVLLANLICAPIEALVRRYYINDAKKTLAECPELCVVGITGSYGKTSMKFFLTTILKRKYNVLMTPESYNTPMGVVKTVRGSLRGYHEIFVCEMGAKKVGEIKELCDIVSPRHGIVTSIGPQHLESFRTVENVIKTKFELCSNLNGGKAFVNIDNEYIRENRPAGTVTYGTSADADYRATVLSVDRSGTSFSVAYPDGESVEFKTALIGGHNVVNLCGAVAMADFLGVSKSEAVEGVAHISPVPHRLQLLEKGGVTVIDDAFNSNPSGCKAALDALALFNDSYKVIVTPGMVELGQKEAELNTVFGTQIAAVCDYAVLVGEKRSEPIMKGLLSAGFDKEKIFVASDVNTGIAKAYSVSPDRSERVILLENDLPDNY